MPETNPIVEITRYERADYIEVLGRLKLIVDQKSALRAVHLAQAARDHIVDES